MVQLGIMSVETSQEILGLDPSQEGKRAKQSAQAEIDELYSNGEVFEVEQNAKSRTRFGKEEEVCGNCVYWDGSKNYCSIHKIEKSFDDLICRQFSIGELDAEPSAANTI